MIHLPSTTDHADTIWRWSNATRRFVGKSKSSRWRIYDGYPNTGNSLSTRSEFVVRDHDWRYHSFTGFSCWFVNEPNPLIYFQFFIWTLNRSCSWERSGFMFRACLDRPGYDLLVLRFPKVKQCKLHFKRTQFYYCPHFIWNAHFMFKANLPLPPTTIPSILNWSSISLLLTLISSLLLYQNLQSWCRSKGNILVL